MDNTTPSSTSDNEELANILFDLVADAVLNLTLHTGDTGVDRAQERILAIYARPPIVQDAGELRDQIITTINNLDSFSYTPLSEDIADALVPIFTAQTQRAVDSAVVEGKLEALNAVRRFGDINGYDLVRDYLKGAIPTVETHLQQQQKDDGHE